MKRALLWTMATVLLVNVATLRNSSQAMPIPQQTYCDICYADDNSWVCYLNEGTNCIAPIGGGTHCTTDQANQCHSGNGAHIHHATGNSGS